MRIKVITGFRKDQRHSIVAQEAHKAYYLFLNPDARTIFSNGLALKGSEIDRIEPDYQGTMGWNPTHTIDDDDMNEIRERGIDRKLRSIMSAASAIARFGDDADLALRLTDAVKKYPQLNEEHPKLP